jgi:RNA polymerase sigma factor (sigma-70 family)
MSMSQDDAALVRQVLGGDAEAFAGLVAVHQGAAIAAARHLIGDAEIARDLAQEAFVAAYRDLRKLRDPAAFGAWLHGIVRNLCRRHYARREPRPASLERDDLPHASSAPPEPNATLAAISGLPIEHRDLLVARFLADMDYRQIAAMLGTSVGNVRVRCCRARQALRTALHAMEVE